MEEEPGDGTRIMIYHLQEVLRPRLLVGSPSGFLTSSFTSFRRSGHLTNADKHSEIQNKIRKKFKHFQEELHKFLLPPYRPQRIFFVPLQFLPHNFFAAHQKIFAFKKILSNDKNISLFPPPNGWASDTHPHTLDGCVCRIDGVNISQKNGQTDKAILGVRFSSL